MVHEQQQNEYSTSSCGSCHKMVSFVKTTRRNVRRNLLFRIIKYDNRGTGNMNGKARNACRILVAKSKKKIFGDLGLDGKITMVYDVSHRNIVQGCGINLCESGYCPV